MAEKQAHIIEVKLGYSTIHHEAAEIQEPIRTRMTRDEAIRRVHQYEREMMKDWDKQVEEQGEVDADKISQAVSSDASRSSGESQRRGRAI